MVGSEQLERLHGDIYIYICLYHKECVFLCLMLPWFQHHAPALPSSFITEHYLCYSPLFSGIFPQLLKPSISLSAAQIHQRPLPHRRAPCEPELI